MAKKKRVSVKRLEEEGYRRFIFLERPKEINKTLEIVEVLYHTILPFIVGLLIDFQEPKTMLWSLIMIFPLMFRYYHVKGKQRLYFRLN